MQRPLRGHVVDHVAMKQPVACTVGNPCHVKTVLCIHMLGDGFAALRFGIMDEVRGISDAIDSKEKAMQVHGMSDRCRVDDPPMDRFTGCVSEALGFWPGLTVHADYEAFAAWTFVPAHDDEDAIVLSGAGRVNNEGPGEQSLLTLTFLAVVEVSAGSGCPVQVGARLACIKLHFTGFSSLYLHERVGVTGMRMPPVDFCRQRKKIVNAGVNARALRHSKER